MLKRKTTHFLAALAVLSPMSNLSAQQTLEAEGTYSMTVEAPFVAPFTMRNASLVRYRLLSVNIDLKTEMATLGLGSPILLSSLSWSLSGSLPSGLTLNQATGVITGTPSSAQTVNVTVTATGGGHSASATLTLSTILQTCSSAGGSSVDGTCRFNAASCPSGWAQDQYWRTYTTQTCYIASASCTQLAFTSDPTLNAWANISFVPSTTSRTAFVCPAKTTTYTVTCAPIKSQVGCVRL